MSTTTSMRPPGEEDLQKLYNDVLAGFGEEPSSTDQSSIRTSNERDLYSLYSSYAAGEDEESLKSSQVKNHVSPSPTSATTPYATSPRDRPLPDPRDSPTQMSGRPRRLPPLPGTAASPTSATSMTMPEPHPHPYKHDSADSYVFQTDSSDLRRKVTSGSISNRRLPSPLPNGSQNGNSYAAPPVGRAPPPRNGLPSSVRPAYNSQSTARSTRTDSSSISGNASDTNSPYNPMLAPSLYESNAAASRETFDSVNPEIASPSSSRPAGASAPKIPGYDARNEGTFADFSSNGFPSPSTSGFYSQDGGSVSGDHSSRFVPRGSSYRAMDTARPKTAQQPSASSLVSNGSLGAYGNHTRGQSESTHRPTTGNSFVADPRLDRTISATSTTSSQSPGTNHPPSTINTTYEDSFSLGRPSTTTSVTRGNSARTTSSDGLYATDSYFAASATVVPPVPPQAYPADRKVNPYTAEASGSRPEKSGLEAFTAVKGPLALHDGLETYDEYDDWDGEYSEPGDDDFANFSLLSHIAMRLRDKIPRGTHVKGSIPYPRAFTGKDIVSTIQSLIQRDLLINHNVSTNDRRVALQVARSLQSQLFFYEVEWGGRVLQDGVEDVYMFLDDQEGGSEMHPPEREELPTGVITALTKCYSPSCGEGQPCFSYACPLRGAPIVSAPAPAEKEQARDAKKGLGDHIPKEVLDRLPPSEIRRQTIIHKVISKEEDYVEDLDTVEALFIKPLRTSNVIRPAVVDDFIDEVFGNILDLRQCNRNLLEELYVRQREQFPVIQRIGDVFLEAATQFRLAYPLYLGHLPLAEKRLKDEIEENGEFRLFLEENYRKMAKNQQSRCLNLKHFLTRPTEHLQKYPVLLDAILHETDEENADTDYLSEATQAIKNLQTIAQLRTFQTAMGRGPTGNWEWHDLLSKEERQAMVKQEAKRQSIIFELIKGEMMYVKDLEAIDTMYVQQLRDIDPPIIPRDRLESFIRDVFHNFMDIHAHHRRLLETFFEIQREEHPTIRSVIAPLFDAALNFREAYMEYVPNYPIAAYRIEDEMGNNPAFRQFAEDCQRHPDANRKPMKDFVVRPIPRLLRYQLLLKAMLDETPPGHEDIDAIPQVLDVLASLGKETQPGVTSSEQKVELWRYNSNLVFKPGEAIDMDLLDENRSLIHTGKFLRQPDTGFEWNGWTELSVILFDNYLVIAKAKERDGLTKYHVNRRPIPLDLLTLANFSDPPTIRNTGIQRILRGGERVDSAGPAPQMSATTPDSSGDSRAVYPCTIHHNGRLGGLYTMYTDSAQARAEWKQKLEEAIGLRKAVQENNKVFEIETLSTDTFLVPSMLAGAATPSWNSENSYTGKVTCSVPFNTSDGRGLVAIGCAEGVWIGFRHDSRSMRRVLHLKMVTQCAMLADFGIFLVLADKSLFAYHIEALVPSAPQGQHNNNQPQKLNGTKDVHFFSVGNLHGRTLVIYMKKKGLDSVFRVLEPVMDKIVEKTKAPVSIGSRLGFRTPRSEWFRVYRDFFLPSESFDLVFLKAKIAILCTKGFEIMDLTDFKSVTIPLRDDPRLEKLAKRCEACRPKGMFRSNDEEFLLCYDEFGLYVDKHGDPSRSFGTIEWEGTAESVALHGKYVLLFDSRFIEIRHVETGRLAQIIPGNDVRCLWDGGGPDTNPLGSPGGWTDGMSQEPRVHGVTNVTDAPQTGPNRAARAVTQHVFELVPTIPLYLPESLASPSAANYYPQSSSPPHSPRLNAASSWRR